ncbi:3,4-dihydroxy-2-butanone 4-phosphate synthase [Rugosibacter aromaticivorans]|uniref:3,4-dihydroxy-2-butanone 4-phosphate synthase n=1 Tax=Rugosibacter aromaticivorans TaxID=1565605 RepID=A0A0C5J726_9PROT|nr:bifunctional 3,4-dihydroxy-2-butanone-4-phosphate synthase/GTP cyclohydrolase II [Rugosibacter aromaticivorans]AJP47454.1 3,4-dihydroxy-2-butanone 4-phosphate synthase [Rugosibacter aromaticivorans]TBR15688.1 MAG: 3,4-dihydroxy-2-butanone-4-phosphate synthase [Rugosibacter sp.]
MNISPTQDIIAEIRAGHMVILVDEEDRENEGDLVCAAQHITPEMINFMVKHARGLVCLTLTEARCQQLGLSPMTRNNKSMFSTAFTTSIEAATGVTTGISAHDRARTVQVAVAKNACAEDIVQPGHIFPIAAQPGGVLVRAGHTEAGCDLAQMAGCEAAAVICEILKDDGSMARLPDLLEFAAQHQLKIGTIRDLIHYRSETETLIECVADKEITCAQGTFRLRAFVDKTSGDSHLALSHGEISADQETLVRVHEAVSVLDFLGVQNTRHSFSIDFALRQIAVADRGVVVMLHHAESTRDMLTALQVDAVARKTVAKWDPRLYGIGAQILRDLGVGKMRLMSNPRKMPSMAGFGLEICGYFAP